MVPVLEKKRAVGYLATSTNSCKDSVDLGLIASFPSALPVLNKKWRERKRNIKKQSMNFSFMSWIAKELGVGGI